MRLFGRVPDWARREFTHYGWFLACPVYLNPKSGRMYRRHWVPDRWMRFNYRAFAALASAWSMLGGDVTGLPTWQTGRILAEAP